jgi:hypothetical protein
VSHRRPAFVLGLTVGDYLLWNWSLNGNHDVIALVSGLTLPPLALLSIWLLAMAAGRLLGGVSGRARNGARARSRSSRRSAARRRARRAPAPTEPAARPAPADAPSRRIAA